MAFTDDIKTEGQFWRECVKRLDAIAAGGTGGGGAVTGSVKVWDGTNSAGISTSGADATTNTDNRLKVTNHEKLFNGATWDLARSGLVAPTASPIGFQNELPFVRYNATPPTLTDGQLVVLQGDVNGRLNTASVSIANAPLIALQRPNDTTPYGAGDVYGQAASGILQFTSVAPSNAKIRIVGADLRFDLAAVPAGMTAFRLHLYSASPTAAADNSVWDLDSGSRSVYLGFIDLGAPIDVGSTLFVQQVGWMTEIQLVGTSLYAELVTIAGFTPTSGGTGQIRLQIEVA